jgi:hypothetical protein
MWVSMQTLPHVRYRRADGQDVRELGMEFAHDNADVSSSRYKPGHRRVCSAFWRPEWKSVSSARCLYHRGIICFAPLDLICKGSTAARLTGSLHLSRRKRQSPNLPNPCGEEWQHRMRRYDSATLDRRLDGRLDGQLDGRLDKNNSKRHSIIIRVLARLITCLRTGGFGSLSEKRTIELRQHTIAQQNCLENGTLGCDNHVYIRGCLQDVVLPVMCWPMP